MKAIRADLFKRCDHAEAKRLDCPCSWYFRFHWHGRAYPHVGLDARLGKYPDARWPAGHVARLTDAETYADECKALIRAGAWTLAPAAVAPPAPAADAITWAAFVTRYGEARENTEHVSWNNDPGMLRQLGRVTLADGRTLNAIPLAAVTDTILLDAFKSTRKRANGTRKKYRGALVRACRWAVAKSLVAASPLTAGTEWPTVGKQKIRMVRLGPTMIANLSDAARADARDPFGGQRLADLIEGAAATGARVGELLAMKVADIHFGDPADEDDPPYIELTATEQGARKTGTARQVPLPAAYAATLTRRIAGLGDGAYVYADETGGRIKSVKKAWLTAVCRAHGIRPAWTKSGGGLAAGTRAALKAINGGEGVWWTDLRHAAALRWHEEGVELNAIAALLGHASLDMLRVYLKITGRDALKAHARASGSSAPPPLGRTAKAANRSKPIQTGRSLRLVKTRKTG